MEELKEENGEGKKLNFKSIQTQISFLEGKILTIIDASIEGKKNEAMKGLIKEKFREQLEWIDDICFPCQGKKTN